MTERIIKVAQCHLFSFHLLTKGVTMKIGINCGHTASGAGYGAVGIIKESEHTRLVGRALMKMLSNVGFEVIDCTVDKADTQSEYLKKSVDIANGNNVDLFISIHFNASPSHDGNGVEVFTHNGIKHEEAVKICQNISDLGFKNRGIKYGSDLYVIKKTVAKSMLIEVCFCDNETDVSTYLTLGEDKIAQAIFDALNTEPKPETAPKEENHSMTHDEFIEFVGNIARKDWIARRICLPSIVIAQAIKESGWGTSELARNANAIFGIKQNGWIGELYYKIATEQGKDGQYSTTDKAVAWRAYDSWEQSILDHNTYIAERRVGNQTAPNFAEVIGESNLKKAIAGLVGDEYRQQSADNCKDEELKQYVLQGKTQFPYATSHTYAQSLLSDYIERYGLTRFDEATEEKSEEKPSDNQNDDTAPDGMLYVVQVGAYKSKKNAENFIKKLEGMGVKSMLKLYPES